MTDASNLPLALYKANLELWLHLGQLLKDNREQWMGLLTRELEQRMSEARRGAGNVPAAADLPSMAMLPGSELWRIAEQQVSDLQALAQTASGNQMAFVNGFQQALEEWQQATASAFGEAAGDVELPAQPFQGLHDTFEQLSNALLSGMGALGPAAAPAPGTGAPRPAANKAPARKAARAAKRPARKAARKTAAPATKKAVKKVAKKAAKAPARKAAKKATKKVARKVAKKAPKKAARRTARKATAR